MVDKLPKTQEEARSVLAQRIKDTIEAYNAAVRAGDKTQSTQLFQQYQDLNKQFEAAKLGTAGSVGTGMLSGARQNFDLMGRALHLTPPTTPSPPQSAKRP